MTNKNNFIHIRSIEPEMDNNLKIELNFKDILVYKNEIANIKKDDLNKNYFIVNAINNTGHYKGFIINKYDKIVNKLEDVKKLMSK